MANADTVHWLRKEMQGARRIGSPIVGYLDWPNPAQADPPELTRTLNEADVTRAVDPAHRRGVGDRYIVAVWDATEAAHRAGETIKWIADLIDILDTLPPARGSQPPSLDL
jgi:hypothetical protein